MDLAPLAGLTVQQLEKMLQRCEGQGILAFYIEGEEVAFEVLDIRIQRVRNPGSHS